MPAPQRAASPLLRVSGLVKHFPIKKGLLGKLAGAVRAVDGVSFDVMPGETLGLVGESGCGKSTTGRMILRLIEPTAGSIEFDGIDLVTLDTRQMRKLRRKIQVIFQDPFSSLNPRMTVGSIIREGLTIHKIAEGSAADARVRQLLDEVGLRAEYMSRYPHEFSGGQRQRIGIARALAVEPTFIVCDEPVSALDVSVQAQVINLMTDLQAEFGLSYLFIAHDLSVVKHISHRIAVMYLGKIVELADCRELFSNPLHPYTEALLSAVPLPNPKKTRKKRIILKGDVPSPISPPSGCRFHTRCPLAFDRCKIDVPEFREVAPGHWAACHLR
jgi:oligopeptide/dipeptide ABC transporter ATP-binding protein